MKLAGALAAVLALLVAPIAGADGGVTWHVSDGKAGDNGWYQSPVTIAITAPDPTTCPTKATFATSSDYLDCTQSGVGFHFQFKIDGTPPATGAPATDRGPDKNGWYDHPVAVTFSGSDTNSGIASCTSVQYAGPDNAPASVTGTCRDIAGNVSAPTSFALKYDATPPSISATTARPADAGGWFNHPVAVSFAGSDNTSGVASCTGGATYSGPDTASTTVGGSCTDNAGNTASGSLTLKYDATPPKITDAVSRPPDDNGWYTHPVTLTFSGKDDGSGVASCTGPVTYSGPDGGAAKATGRCTDAAGNAATLDVPLRYDDTAPKLGAVSIDVTGADATLSWKQPSDTATVVVDRSPGRSGKRPSRVYAGHASRFRDQGLRPGVDYRYTLRSVDKAGNAATTVVVARPRALFAPAAGATAHAGTRLAWVATAGAAYYNVQLFRNGQKVLSTWPLGPSMRLPRTWSYAGRQQSLSHGRYRWYVWPGKGKRSRAAYGPLLGSSTFRVR